MNEPFDVVGIVIVFYFPTKEQIERLKRLANFKYVYVIDNTPGEEHKLNLPEFVNYYPFLQNTGIAHALNEGIKMALDEQCKYVCLFDQDSDYSDKLIIELYNSFQKAKQEIRRIGIIAPRIEDRNSDLESIIVKNNSHSFECVSQLITSGSFIDSEVLRDIGLMDERLFIDLVDTEWCFRAKKNNYQLVKAHNVVLIHNLGIKTIKKCGVILTISNPFRYFYQYRNLIMLLSRGYVPFKYKMEELYARLIGIFIYPINSTKPIATFKWIIKGLLAGIGLYNYEPVKTKN